MGKIIILGPYIFNQEIMIFSGPEPTQEKAYVPTNIRPAKGQTL
jgi:hypothetical protein